MTLSEDRATRQAAQGGLRASVIIPTYNRRQSLERVLRALGRQTVAMSDFETLVIADGCSDGTEAMCRVLAAEAPYALRLLEQANAGPAAARDRAVREARAPLIVFIDDDVVPAPDLLETHFAAHQAAPAEDYIVAIGPLLPPRDERLNAWGAWEERVLCAQYDQMSAGRWAPTYRQFYTGNASVARARILEAGGFDSAYRRAEDVELGLRLTEHGCAFRFVAEARGWHYVRRTFASWVRMPVAYGRATVAMGRTHGTHEVTLSAAHFHRRNVLARTLAHLCIGAGWRVALATAALRWVITLGWATRCAPLSYLGCSSVYNLRYYHGMALELGDVGVFWGLIAVGREAAGHADDHERHAGLQAYARRLLGLGDEQAHDVAIAEQVEVGARQ